jgi:hypothetical protein
MYEYEQGSTESTLNKSLVFVSIELPLSSEGLLAENFEFFSVWGGMKEEAPAAEPLPSSGELFQRARRIVTRKFRQTFVPIKCQPIWLQRLECKVNIP